MYQTPNSTAAVCQWAGSSTATRLSGPAPSSSRSRLAVLAAQLASVDGRQLDPLAGRVVVVGDARARPGPRGRAAGRSNARELTVGASVDALRIVRARGDDRRRRGSRRSVDSDAAGSAVASVGSVPSRPGAGAGVVAAEHHPHRSRRAPTGRRRPAGRPAPWKPPARQGHRSWRPAPGWSARRPPSWLPTVPVREALAGQHRRHRGGQAVDVGVVDHLGGGLVRRVGEFLGLALVLVLQQAGDPVLAPGWDRPGPRSASRRRSSRSPRAPGWWRTRRCPPPASAAARRIP